MSWRWIESKLTPEFKRHVEKVCTIVGNTPARGQAPIVQAFYQIKKGDENWLVTPYFFSRNQWSGLDDETKSCLIKTKSPEKIPEKTVCNIKLRDYQEQAIIEVKGILKKHRATLLSAYCGWGKTKSSLYLANQLGYVTAILIKNATIRKQWIDDIKATYKLSPRAVKEGWKLCEIVNSKKMSDKCLFYFINPTIVPNLVKNVEDPLTRIGTVIIDECDEVATQTMSKCLAFFSPRYMLGLSATPTRRDGLDKVLNLYLGTEWVVRKNPKPLRIFRVLTDFVPPKENNERGDLDWQLIENEQALDEDRNILIAKMAVACYRKFKKEILVVTKRVEHAKIVYRNIKELLGGKVVGKYIEKDKIVPKTPIVVATSKKAGRGFDSKADILIWGYSTNSPTEIIQVSGRVGRNSEFGMIFDLVDVNTHGKPDSLMDRHWRTRGKCYKERPKTKIFYTDHKEYKSVLTEENISI